MDRMVTLDQMVTEILRQQDELETTYGVEIQLKAIHLACDITIRHSNGSVQKKTFGLVKNACLKLRHHLDTDAEENALDTDEYLLYRALVELDEIKKEKDHGKRLWIPRLEKEYQDLKDKWNIFMMKSKPIVLSRNSRRGNELQMLEQVRQELVSFMQEAEADKKTEMKPIFGLFRCLLSLRTHENLKQSFAVTPRLVAKVASPLTGFPASWLLCGSKPPLQDLESRLAERLIGQEHVSFLISRALSRQKFGPGPIGSFLFLYGSGRGRTELAKALAKQLFDDDKLLTEVDMSDYREPDSASCLFGAPSSGEECGAGGLLTEAVKKRPFGVILLDNVDGAHPSVTDLLINVLSHGRVLEGVGNTVYFTNTLIVMTSNIADRAFDQSSCRCLWSQDGPMKDKLYHDSSYPEHRCVYLNNLTEARKYFKPELFEKLDEVIVFNVLSPDQNMAVGRLELRDIASSITGRRLMVYPSEAVLRQIAWRELFRPYIREACSYLEDWFLKHFKVSLKEFRIMYRKEKERAYNINLLRRDFFTLMNLLNAGAVVYFSCVADTVQKLLNAVDDLIGDAVDALSMETSNCSNGKTEPLVKERPRNQVQGLSMFLDSRVVGQNQAIDVVVEALQKSIHSPNDLPHRPTMSLLFLGLTSVGLADLVRSLAENFVSEDVTGLLIDVDLSKYRDSDSLFRRLYEPLEPSICGQHDLPLLELVQTRPHSILVFSQVEQAHISVFSALLSVLDQDMGNSKVLAQLVGHAHPYDSSVEVMQQKKRGFRSELLNRIDEIVCFNPFAREQLRKVARLSMRAGRHLDYLEGDRPFALSRSILNLFAEAHLEDRPPNAICAALRRCRGDPVLRTVSFLAKGLINCGSDAH